MSTGQRADDDADDDADLAVDLDAVTGPDPDAVPGGDRLPGGEPGDSPRGTRSRFARWPGAVPEWARGPAAVLVLVLLAGALGAAAGASHREARDARTALQQALTAGYVFIAGQDRSTGHLRADLRVALTNHGPDPLVVRLQGLTAPHQGTASVPDEVTVDGGGAVAAPLSVDVDCAAQGDAVAAPTAVLASVRPDGDDAASAGVVDVSLPVLDGVADDLRSRLAAACGDVAVLDPETGWLWQDGGALRVTVTNPPLGRPVQLVLESSDGLAATAEPSLPRDLRPGETAVLDLRVAPDCDVVGDGSDSWLDLQAVSPQGSTTSLGRGSGSGPPVTGTGPWLARQVALACG